MKSSPSDDIPLARRSTPPSKGRRSKSRIWLKVFGTFAVLLFGTGFWLTLRTSDKPRDSASLARLAAQRTSDDRLLGHFPYPEASASHLVTIAPGMRLHRDAATSFLAMREAAAADGISLSVLSAFRSVNDQKQLFFDVKAERNQTSMDRAKVSAPPGFSEHSTGYAIDFGDPSRPDSNLSPAFAATPAYRWLVQNAARYQFVLSFPEANAQGVSFEPWHWRFEGSVDALRLFEPAQRLQGGPSLETIETSKE
jgi:D-alanyl-D-alanine carboxypeptidase